jgi:hypothetical protein
VQVAANRIEGFPDLQCMGSAVFINQPKLGVANLSPNALPKTISYQWKTIETSISVGERKNRAARAL